MPAIRQTSTQQLEHMIRYIEKNPTLSGSNPNQTHRGKTNHRAWNILMHQLNSLEGNKKSAENWRKYWNHLKYRTKNKIIEYQKFKRSPNNFAIRIPPLNSTQRRIWRILLREKNKEIQISTSDTTEKEIDDSLSTKELDEDLEEVVETVIMDVNKSSDAQMEDLEPQNTTFDFFLVDSERDNHLSNDSQSMQETPPTPKKENTYNKAHNYVKIKEEEEVSEVEEEVNEEEEDVTTKKKNAKRKPHRMRRATHSESEEENEKPDVEMEIAELQKELLKKQILVEEQKLFQIKLQNEVLKKQLQEESEKYSHNHMKRSLEKEELQQRNLDKYSD